MRKQVFKITIHNWEKYNKSVKKGHPCIMLSKRFFDDVKIQRLPAGGRLLYLGLLLRRGEVDSTFIEASYEDLLRFAGGSGQVVSRLLSLLESFQMVTVEKIEPLNELKRKEVKRSEVKRVSSEVADAEQNKTPELNKKIWESYRQEYLLRHKVEPVRNASVNAKVSQLAKRLGEEAIDVVRFYIWHNDGFYLKKLHDIGLCLKDCESLRTQWLRGTQVTSQTVRNFEKTSNLVALMEDAKKGGF